VVVRNRTGPVWAGAPTPYHAGAETGSAAPVVGGSGAPASATVPATVAATRGAKNTTTPKLPGPSTAAHRVRAVRLVEVEFVGLADQVDSEAVVRLLRDEPESARQVEAPGGDQRVVGPQAQPGVPGGAREVHAGVDQPAAQTVPPRIRMYKQDAQL